MLGMVVGLKASLVDDNLVVVPAQGDEVLRVGGSVFAPWDEMVDLETVGALTSVCPTAVPVAVDDGPT
jgi:hypothetical protein